MNLGSVSWWQNEFIEGSHDRDLKELIICTKKLWLLEDESGGYNA